MAKVTAPSKEFTGKRGPVAFIDGVAETSDPSMLAYFRRHGYEVEDAEKSAPAKRPAAKKAAAKKAATKPADAEPAKDEADASNPEGDGSELSSDK